MEAELCFKHNVFSMRATFADIAREAQVDEASNALFFRGKEIGLVYYRTGYSIEQYENTDADVATHVDKWKARELLEFSMPVKLPSIDYQLTTFKKFQQALSDKSLLVRAAKNEDDANKVAHLFKGIWSLEDFGKEGAEIN